jgi:hypothetical protein
MGRRYRQGSTRPGAKHSTDPVCPAFSRAIATSAVSSTPPRYQKRVESAARGRVERASVVVVVVDIYCCCWWTRGFLATTHCRPVSSELAVQMPLRRGRVCRPASVDKRRCSRVQALESCCQSRRSRTGSVSWGVFLAVARLRMQPQGPVW